MVNGYRKEKDLESRERWCIARKIMWSNLAPNSKQKMTEKDIILFPWETELLENVERVYDESYLAELEVTRLFWENYDAKQNKA